MGAKISKAVRRPDHQRKAAALTTSHGNQNVKDPESLSQAKTNGLSLPEIKCDPVFTVDVPTDPNTTTTELPTNADAPASTQPSSSANPETSQENVSENIAMDGPVVRGLYEHIANDEAASSQVKDPPEPPKQVCNVCYESYPQDATLVEICKECCYKWCINCIRALFLGACKDLTRMPPQCCSQIRLYQAKPYLSKEEAMRFRLRYEEWITPRPMYCPVPTCSAFIPNRLLPKAKPKSKGKQRIDSGVGTPNLTVVGCPECKTEICMNCRQLAHEGICSSQDFAVDSVTADLLKAWGYRKCPKCGHGVRRMYGCSHMACICGAHFCWGCLMSVDDGCSPGCHPDEDDDFDEDEVEEAAPPGEDAHENDPPQQSDVVPESSAKPAESPPTSPDQPSQAPVTEVPSPSQEPSPSRPLNLDAGSYDYWRAQEMDFGPDPGDIGVSDELWHCKHRFDVIKLSLKEALTTEMECDNCWCIIRPDWQYATGFVEPREYFHNNNSSNNAIETESHPTASNDQRPTSSHSAPQHRTDNLVEGVRELINRPQVSLDDHDVWILRASNAPRAEPIKGVQAILDETLKKRSLGQHKSKLNNTAYQCVYCHLHICDTCKKQVLADQEEERRNEEEEDDDDADDDDANDNDNDDGDDDSDSVLMSAQEVR